MIDVSAFFRVHFLPTEGFFTVSLSDHFGGWSEIKDAGIASTFFNNEIVGSSLMQDELLRRTSMQDSIAGITVTRDTIIAKVRMPAT